MLLEIHFDSTEIKVLHQNRTVYNFRDIYLECLFIIGEILTFDNTRMVHGRTGFTDETGNSRHLVGAYLDWDEIYSRIRVLDAEISKTVKQIV